MSDRKQELEQRLLAAAQEYQAPLVQDELGSLLRKMNEGYTRTIADLLEATKLERDGIIRQDGETGWVICGNGGI